MDGNGLTASDIALLNGDGTGGWNGMFWIFALLCLMGGGFGGFGFGNNAATALGYENLATSNELQRGFDNQNSMANQRDILSAVTNGTAQSIAATNQTYHDTVSYLGDKYNELQRDIAANAVSLANLQANENECCCSTKMLVQQTSANTDAQIAQNRYEAAMNTAAINATTTAQTQKILDAMAQNKIESLQSQVNQLQLAQATAGVLKFPNSWSYGAGPFPPIFGGCNGYGNV